ncbi:hypothetical protein ABZ177_28350 [Streptomyces sp. NPDC006284]|uniref:hypothetical protein n=1 Tax=Streptomyces sp. NPDC006284 TaxID=3156742 RepID=UPI0033ACBEEF
MKRDSLTVETPAGTVIATAGPRSDAVVFELGGAMRGSVYVTGTHHPQHWDRFTAVRACLGPVNAYQTTAPDDALPRLARGHSGYRGSLTLYPDVTGRPRVSVYPMETAAGHELSPKTGATLTAVLRACAEHVMQHEDLPALLTASRQRDTPALLRFLDWSVTHHRTEAARLEAEARAAQPDRRAAVAAWWTVARWFTASPHLVLLVMLADYPGSLSRHISVMEWLAPYCLAAASREHDHARRAEIEAACLRNAQIRQRAREQDLAVSGGARSDRIRR